MHQPYLSCSNLHSKYTKVFLYNREKRIIYVSCCPLAFKTSIVLFYFYLKKHISYLAFNILTTVHFLYCLFWSFLRVNTYTAPWLFVDRVKKRNCYVSKSTLRTKNMSDNLCGVSFCLNLFFLPFSRILSWKCINDSYLVAVYTLNTPTTPYSFVYNR